MLPSTVIVAVVVVAPYARPPVVDCMSPLLATIANSFQLLHATNSQPFYLLPSSSYFSCCCCCRPIVNNLFVGRKHTRMPLICYLFISAARCWRCGLWELASFAATNCQFDAASLWHVSARRSHAAPCDRTRTHQPHTYVCISALNKGATTAAIASVRPADRPTNRSLANRQAAIACEYPHTPRLIITLSVFKEFEDFVVLWFHLRLAYPIRCLGYPLQCCALIAYRPSYSYRRHRTFHSISISSLFHLSFHLFAGFAFYSRPFCFWFAQHFWWISWINLFWGMMMWDLLLLLLCVEPSILLIGCIIVICFFFLFLARNEHEKCRLMNLCTHPWHTYIHAQKGTHTHAHSLTPSFSSAL